MWGHPSLQVRAQSCRLPRAASVKRKSASAARASDNKSSKPGLTRVAEAYPGLEIYTCGIDDVVRSAWPWCVLNNRSPESPSPGTIMPSSESCQRQAKVSVGGASLGSKPGLTRVAEAYPGLEIYTCGIDDVVRSAWPLICEISRPQSSCAKRARDCQLQSSPVGVNDPERTCVLRAMPSVPKTSADADGRDAVPLGSADRHRRNCRDLETPVELCEAGAGLSASKFSRGSK
jgi:hypothetical protein